MGLPRAQAQGSVEQHRCVHTGLRRWHLIPPVPELMAQSAAMGGFGLITITSAPLEKIQLGLPWPVLEHSCSQPQALQGFLCLALLPAHPPEMSPKGLHPARQLFLCASSLWVTGAHKILHKAGILCERAQ